MTQLSKSSDAGKEGIAMAARIAGQLKAVPGVRGIHILCGGSEAVAGDVIAAAALA